MASQGYCKIPHINGYFSTIWLISCIADIFHSSKKKKKRNVLVNSTSPGLATGGLALICKKMMDTAGGRPVSQRTDQAERRAFHTALNQEAVPAEKSLAQTRSPC